MRRFILGAALFVPIFCFAQSGGEASSAGSAPWSFVGRKAEVKRQSRWSLDEWLATRDRMKWADMWLALNSSSPYEFFILGAYNLVPTSQGRLEDVRFGLGAYVKIFGLEYDHDNILGPEDNARLHLRIFGYHVQNTNITLHGGIRFRPGTLPVRQGYLGLSTTIYLQKYFGFYTLYRYYWSVGEHRLEIGPFIDFGPLRIFGNYLYQQPANGWILGGQFFF
jgi:hypothetical protein